MKINFKSFTIGFIVSAFIFTSLSTFAEVNDIKAFYNNIKIKVNGRLVNIPENDQPFIKDGRTFVPARYVAENLNATVKWNETDNTVEITNGQITSSTTTPTIKQEEYKLVKVTPIPIPPKPQQTDLATEDGIRIYIINDKQYVQVIDVGLKYNVSVMRKSSDNQYAVYTNESRLRIISKEPFDVFEYVSREYFDLATYLNIIYPIVRQISQ
jgi:hypothetical protein